MPADEEAAQQRRTSCKQQAFRLHFTTVGNPSELIKSGKTIESNYFNVVAGVYVYLTNTACIKHSII